MKQGNEEAKKKAAEIAKSKFMFKSSYNLLSFEELKRKAASQFG